MVFLAVLITGGFGASGFTAELFLPNGTSCTLPASFARLSHTVDNHIMCGGQDSAGYLNSRSCLLWNPDSGTWEDWGEELNIGRYRHVSWTPSGDTSGTYLMGGFGDASIRTTTLVKRDGTQEPGFPLIYHTE